MVDYAHTPIQILPGVEPTTDKPSSSTQHYTYADKVRFVDGFPEKIGGWAAATIDMDQVPSGAPRGYFSYVSSSLVRALIGTNTRLYSFFGSQLTNVTPLVTATTAIASSLDTYYISLGTDPITTVSGSTNVTITDTATKLRAGDTVTISGVPGDVNGIPQAQLNAALVVRAQDTNSITVSVSTAATSSGSGGGGSVVAATGIITVNATAHGMLDGDRVKIAGAATTGGITDAQINLEFLIRNVATNTFDIVTAGTATSSVSGGGGASTTFQPQIAAGEVNQRLGQGYGMGRYGVGLYGVSKTSTSSVTLPRVWSFDSYGTNVVLTPGNQSGVYSWNSDTDIAPALVSNAPTAVNYVFSDKQILVTLGASGVGNRIKWSDQGDITTWTPATTNQAGEDDIEGAGTFLSHVNVRGINLIFANKSVYTMRYIGRPLVWDIQVLDGLAGIISQNARVGYNGIAYWMGDKNFYMWRGGNVEIIPSNSGTESTIKQYVFSDLNTSQKSKIFAWFNEEFSEIWWHYPSESSNEPDRIARLNVRDFTWTMDTMERTAAEYPNVLQKTPYLVSIDGVIYKHELGYDDNGEALEFTLSSPFFDSGTYKADIGGVIPESAMNGTVLVGAVGKDYPQSSTTISRGDFSVTQETERIPFTISTRYFQYTVTGSELGQSWRSGAWLQEVKRGTRR